MLKIAIDATPIAISQGGVGYATLKLVKNIFDLDFDNNYILYFSYFNNYYGYQFKRPNVSIVKSPLPYRLTQKLDLYFPLPIELFVGRVDVVHGTAYFVNTMPKTPKIITVHDLAYKILPEVFPKEILREMEIRLKTNIDNSNLILSDSECTKRDLEKYYGVAPHKIRVVLMAADKIFKIINDRETVLSAVRRLGITKEYIIHVGSFEPRKNHLRLLDAYTRLREKSIIDHQLVLVGKTNWLSTDFFEALETSKYRDDIIQIKNVTEEDLAFLYNGADILFYPSLYEGFGLPLTEAMACGTPIVASNVSAIPEVAGDAAEYFTPFSVEEMVQKISQVIHSGTLKKRLKENGLQRAKMFTWKRAAQETIQAYKDVCSN
jgi:glycosyltransferase involved in cell wall biosynthesis